MTLLGSVIVQCPASADEAEEIGLIDNIHQPQRILRPDFVHFAGNQVESRHHQIGNHHEKEAEAGTDGEIAPGAIENQQDQLDRDGGEGIIVVVMAELLKHIARSFHGRYKYEYLVFEFN